MKNKDNRTRQKIIIDNIENYFIEKNISRSDYCKALFIQSSTFSKWKNEDSKFTIEYFEKTINFFSITAYDLFYSDKEKENISILSTNNYTSVKTQKVVNIHKSIQFKGYHKNILLIILIFSLIIFAVSFAFLKNSINSLFIPLIIVILIPILISKMKVKEEYIVGYLDDIFYKIDNPINQFRVKIIWTKVCSIIVVLISFIKIIMSNFNIEFGNYLLFFSLIVIINLILSLINIFLPIKVLKKEIYDHEVLLFNNSIFILVFSVAVLISYILLSIQLKEFSIMYFLLLIGDLLCKICYFVFISKKFSEYKIVISDEYNNIKEL